jgi:hypothetical protein
MIFRVATVGVVVAGVFAIAIACSGGTSTEKTDPAENLGRTRAAVVFNPVAEQGLEWTVKYTSQSPTLVSSGSEYTVAAIGPQGSPAGCSSGAIMGTYGATQHVVRATVPCLSPANCMTSGDTPQPQPASNYLSDTVLCSTSPTPQPGFSRSPDNIFTDAEITRVGPTSFLHFNTSSAPAFLNNCTARNFNPAPNVPNSSGFFVNFYRRSDDCGATWPGTPAVDGSMTYTKFAWIDAAFNINWNFDMPHVYVDPFNLSSTSKPFVYVHGTVALTARGVIESGDAGGTFPNKHYIGDSGLAKNDGFTTGGSMTSTSDGTQFYAGCFFQDVRVYYTYDRWQTYTIMTLNWNGGSTGCNELNPWPANGSQGNVGPHAVSVSRVAFSSLKSGFARVRVAYPTIFVTVAGQKRQAYRFLEVGVPRKGTTGTPYQNQITTLGGTSNLSILEAGFVEPDPFDTPRGGSSTSTTELPDTAVFWSVEADHSVPSLMARYRTWQGVGSFSAPRDLSPVTWGYNNPVWVGDYNRSTYYYDSTAKRGNYLLVWPQGDQALPTKSSVAQPHYNIISMRPALDATTVHVETLNFGSTVNSGPAVSTQGVNMLDIFWVDSNGNLQEKSYNFGWVAGLTQIGQPPAAAGGIQGDPAAVSWGLNRNDVFMRGNDNRVYQAWRDSSPWNWNPNALSTQTIASNPAVASMGVNKLHVFARFSDGSVRYMRWTSAGWDASWTNLGGVTTLDPVATFDTTTLHLFARGGGDCIYHKYTTDGTNWLPGQLTWENLCNGLAATTAPAVASWGPGRLDLFAGYLAPSGGTTIMHLPYENSWQTEWRDLQTNRSGITLGSWPDAVSWGPQRVDVFAKAGNGTLWHTWYTMP